MEYKLTCEHPITSREFGIICGKIETRIVEAKLAKNGTVGKLLTHNLGTILGSYATHPLVEARSLITS